MQSIVKKSLAAVTAAALIAVAPGVGCYEVLAQNMVGVNVGTGVQAVPGGIAGAGLTGLSRISQSQSLSMTPQAALSGVLQTVPNATPAPSIAAPAAMRTGAAVSPSVRTRALGVRTAPTAEAPAVRSAALGVPSKGSIQGRAERKRRAIPSLTRVLESRKTLSTPAKLSEMPAAGAHAAGVRIMDLILGRRSHDGGSVAAVSAGKLGTPARSGLTRAGIEVEKAPVELPIKLAPAPQRAPANKALGFGISLVRMAFGGAAVYGLHAAAAYLLPSLFGFLPLAAVWAVSSGVVLLPAALYARYRLGLRDSARLGGVKLFHDLAIGAYLGAVAVAWPALAGGAFLTHMTMAIPLVAAGSYFGGLLAQRSGGTGGLLDKVMTWLSLYLPAALIGTVAAEPLTLGAIFGLMSLPAMTTVSFFLGRIIASAESGRPFSVPGTLQKIRFPAYTWVLTGVVFGLLTGYVPVWVNYAFFAWMFLGQTKYFNYVYGAALVWAALTGFSAPITFLVIAFTPERAAVWSENLLGRLLKRGPPAPSTRGEPVKLNEEKPVKWPRFHYWLKTGAVIGMLAFMGGILAYSVFGFQKLAVNLAVAGGLSIIPLIFSKWIIKKTMKATPMDETEDPEIYGIMRELRDTINSELAAKGKKPIPMPEMVNVPMPVPNAFATGLSPNRAMVGVTEEMKDMTLNPERTRESLIRLLSRVEPNGKAFAAYRKAIRGTIPGIEEDAGPQEIIEAVKAADASLIKALGVRALRGVMAHEFSHVMHRDMILGAIAGTLSSGIAFASYSVLWAVGHAKAALKSLMDRIRGVKAEPSEKAGTGRYGRMSVPGIGTEESGRSRPQVVEPVSATAVAAASVFTLAKIFAALWAPILAMILQMASSKSREGHADENGARLSEDPEALALGLGFLTTWRPRMGMLIPRHSLPLILSQAHVMTVSPVEQLEGAMPGFVSGRTTVEKKDNFMLNLFITHPDTQQRIERLYDMSRALEKKAGE